MKTSKRAAAFILKDNKILLMKRIKDGVEYFVFPGGSVEEGETLEEALIREMKEEFSIDVVPGKMIYKKYIKNNYDTGRTSYFFLITDFVGQPELGGPEKKRMNENNQYYPYWIKVEDIVKTNNLYSEGARNFIVDYLEKEKVGILGTLPK